MAKQWMSPRTHFPALARLAIGAGLVFSATAGCETDDAQRRRRADHSATVTLPKPAAQAGTSCDPHGDAPFGVAPSGATEVSPQWVRQNGCRVRLIDVRRHDEAMSGIVHGARVVPLDELASAAATFSPREPIVLICRSGRRAARGAEQLERLGFTQVASMTGGMLLWTERGFPVMAPPAPPATSPTADDTVSNTSRGDDAKNETLAARLLVAPHHQRRVASLLLQSSEACVDGRDDDAVVGTPGGDAGDLVVALSAIEAEGERELTDEEIAQAFATHLAHFGRFYMHTDRHALERLARAAFPQLPRDARAARVLHPTSVEERERLKTILTQPTHVGCGHFKLMLTHPETYGVRRALVEKVVTLVYEELWHRPTNIDFVVLDGEHHEKAVVNIHTPGAAHAATNVTVIAPVIDGRSFFVHHPEVAQYLRSEYVRVLYEELDWVRQRATLTTLQTRADRIADAQLTLTLRHLAADLPVIDLLSTDAGLRHLVPKRHAHAPTATPATP